MSQLFITTLFGESQKPSLNQSKQSTEQQIYLLFAWKLHKPAISKQRKESKKHILQRDRTNTNSQDFFIVETEESIVSAVVMRKGVILFDRKHVHAPCRCKINRPAWCMRRLCEHRTGRWYPPYHHSPVLFSFILLFWPSFKISFKT